MCGPWTDSTKTSYGAGMLLRLGSVHRNVVGQARSPSLGVIFAAVDVS